MSKFKVGDRVRTTNKDGEDNCSGMPEGYEYTIAEIFEGKWYRSRVGVSDGVRETGLELINNNLTMNTLMDIGKLSEGDRITARYCYHGHTFKPGEVLIVKSVHTGDSYGGSCKAQREEPGDGTTWYVYADEGIELIKSKADEGIELIKSKKTIMETIKTVAKKLLDPKTKTLIKAGFLDSELNVTSEGQAQLNAISLVSNMDAFVEAAQEKLDEAKENK